MRTDSSAETLEFYSDFIHAALSGNCILIAYCNDNEAFEAAGPVIKRADKETGKILETDVMAEIRALEVDVHRVLIRPGADLAIVLLDCFLQVFFGKSCRHFWRMLHLRFGESCNPMEWQVPPHVSRHSLLKATDMITTPVQREWDYPCYHSGIPAIHSKALPGL